MIMCPKLPNVARLPGVNCLSWLPIHDDDERLTYTASVGTGFSETEAKELYAKPKSIHNYDRPFTTVPDVKRLIHR